MRDAQRPNVPDDPVPRVGLLNAGVLETNPPAGVPPRRTRWKGTGCTLSRLPLSPTPSAWNCPNFGLLTTSVASSSSPTVITDGATTKCATVENTV